MKTVLFIDSSSARFFSRINGMWQLITKPDRSDRLWVIANLPEETLEAIEVPLLFGRDRSHFLQRRLIAAFPHSEYRAAPMISGNWFKPGTAVLTGLTTAETLKRHTDKLDLPIAGVWGISILLTLLARRLSLRNVLLVIPSEHYLRILVLKDGIPVLTRCIHRYGDEHDSDANEILRTRQHLENRRVFEHDAMPPVLYLGDLSQVNEHLTSGGVTLQPLPDALAPRGDAQYLHPLFELVVSSPAGQLASLQLRARHLAESLRQAAYAGCGLSLLAAVLFGLGDLRALIRLHGQEKTIEADLQKTAGERDRLAGRIDSTGLDPELVRQSTKFSALEMEAAPDPASLLRFTAGVIADLPQVRIRTLAFRFPKHDERYCQGHSVIELPLLNRKIDVPLGSGDKPSVSDTQQRFTELQFTILLTDNLAPAAQIEIKKRISAALKANSFVQLMEDPAAFSLINTLKGGFGMDTASTENLWCMSIPWSATSAALSPDSPPLPGERESASLRVKGLP